MLIANLGKHIDFCTYCAVSEGHCVVCSYGFWLSLWYLQTLLVPNEWLHIINNYLTIFLKLDADCEPWEAYWLLYLLCCLRRPLCCLFLRILIIPLVSSNSSSTKWLHIINNYLTIFLKLDADCDPWEASWLLYLLCCLRRSSFSSLVNPIFFAETSPQQMVTIMMSRSILIACTQVNKITYWVSLHMTWNFIHCYISVR